jgi:Na+-transporting methylmalonyl-CoA/oxaloacetate decarboxylase gamma subunit
MAAIIYKCKTLMAHGVVVFIFVVILVIPTHGMLALTAAVAKPHVALVPVHG